jgi:hypothetical protein
VWSRINEEEYELEKQSDPDWTRHEDFNNYIKKCEFGLNVKENDKKVYAEQPKCDKEYLMIFDKLNNLEKTDPIKIVSAHMHARRERVTLVYPGIGSFTFHLKKACSLSQKGAFRGEYTIPYSNTISEFFGNLEFSTGDFH